MVARRAALFRGAADPLGAGRLPLHLLLLSRRLLQGVLGGSTGMHDRRAAQVVSRRALFSTRPAERPPLFPVSRSDLRRHSRRRRHQVVLVRRRLRHRRRKPRADGEHRAPGQLYLRLPFAPAHHRRAQGRSLDQCGQVGLLLGVLGDESQASGLRLAESLLGRLRRPLRPPLLNGRVDRLPDPVNTFETIEYDVLVIGAGGAGLRAAIEASAAGVKVGLICKSLLGKAHTVMAEGGVAAALANVDDRDSWKVHFADTMRGGQYVNSWRMAELHAKEAPDRVRELEAWGAVFDRTKDGRILQRNFGGHKYPRLAHVGDRTGLEMIRTLQDYGVHQGIDVHMEVCVIALLKDGPCVVGAFGYDRARGHFKIFRAKAVVLATGGIGKAYKITSNSWDCTGDGH